MQPIEKGQRSSFKHYTRGCQSSLNNIRMFLQANKTLLQISLLLFIMLIVAFLVFFTSHERLLMGFYAITGWLPKSRYDLINNTLFYTSGDYLRKTLLQAVLISGSFIGLIWCLLIDYFTKKGKINHSTKFIRGISLAEASEVKALILERKTASDLQIDGMPLIKGSEVQHTLMHGTTGAGKSQLIFKKLRHIRKRGERAFIYDKGCTLLEEFYQEGDIILNPFDIRCASWDLWDEAQTAPQFENMAESLIPLQGNVDPFWVKAARTIFSSTAFKMRRDPDRSIEKLVQLLVTMELTDLEKYVRGTEGASLTSGKMEKTAISIRSILVTYVKSMRFLFGVKKENAAPFSLRRWILDDTQTNWVFISTTDENSHALTPLISMWISSASSNLLSLPKDFYRRIYFVLDEITSLHQLPNFNKTLAEARKFGGCFDIGVQNFALMKATYGYEIAIGIFDLLSTRFFFRSPSSVMAKFVSEELGEMEIEEVQENESYGSHGGRDGVSNSTHRILRPIVLYSEIMILENLECYMRLPGRYPVCTLALKYQEGQRRAKNYIPRDIPSMEIIEAAIVNTPVIPEIQAIENMDEATREKLAEASFAKSQQKEKRQQLKRKKLDHELEV